MTGMYRREKTFDQLLAIAYLTDFFYCRSLVDQTDRDRLLVMAVESCKNCLRFQLEAAFGDRIEPGEKLSDNDLRNLFYGNYMEPDAEPSARHYDECESYVKLEKLMKYYLGDYNALSSSPMDLVMFRFAIEHVSR